MAIAAGDRPLLLSGQSSEHLTSPGHRQPTVPLTSSGGLTSSRGQRQRGARFLNFWGDFSWLFGARKSVSSPPRRRTVLLKIPKATYRPAPPVTTTTTATKVLVVVPSLSYYPVHSTAHPHGGEKYPGGHYRGDGYQGGYYPTEEHYPQKQYSDYYPDEHYQNNYYAAPGHQYYGQGESDSLYDKQQSGR